MSDTAMAGLTSGQAGISRGKRNEEARMVYHRERPSVPHALMTLPSIKFIILVSYLE